MKLETGIHEPMHLYLDSADLEQLRDGLESPVVYGVTTNPTLLRRANLTRASLPGFVSIAATSGNGGPRNYGNAFLPPVYQGTALGKAGGPASEATIRNLVNRDVDSATQRRQFDLTQALNGQQLRASPGESPRSTQSAIWR